MQLNRTLCFLALFLVWIAPMALFGAPVITSLSPNHGPIAGGNAVMVMGSGFTGATSITFGKTPAISFNVVDDQNITAIAPANFVSTVTVSVTTGSGTSPVSAGSFYAFQGNWMVYVTNSGNDNVTPIDTSTNTAGTPIPCGHIPVGIAISPDGSTIYVCNTLGNSVTPITVQGPGTAIPVGTSPLFIAITPDGTKGYVTNQGSHDVTPITLAINSTGTPIALASAPSTLAITPDGTTAYVMTSPTIVPINLATNTAGTPIEGVGNSANAIAITPDGTTAYICNFMDNAAVPLTIANNTVGTPITILTVTNNTILPTENTTFITSVSNIIPFLISSNLQQTAIPLENVNLTGIVITPDNKTAYASVFDSPGFVLPINLVNSTVGSRIPIGNFSDSLAITPDPAPIASFTFHTAFAGLPSFFDGTDSVSPVGSISKYIWDFGDGSPLETYNFRVAIHTYSLPGTYNVTLTVVNSAGTSTVKVFTGQTMTQNGGPSAALTKSIQISKSPANITGLSSNQEPKADLTTSIPSSTTVNTAINAELATEEISVTPLSITELSSNHESKANITTSIPAQILSIPTITSVDPNTGPAEGQNQVTLTGTGFIGTTQVNFGSTPAMAFAVLDDNLLIAIAPPGSAVVNITATNSDGTSPVTPANQYQYITPLLLPPTVSSIFPTSGSTTGGISVQITGSNFTGATQVHFGASPTFFTVNSDNTITALSPPGIPGTVDVTVTTAGGTSVIFPGDQFTYFTPVLSPAPPTNFKAQGITKENCRTSEFSILLTWQPSPSPSVDSYRLYRNNVLIAIIPASGPFVYKDREVSKKCQVSYQLIAFTTNGLQSQPAIVTVP